MMPPLCAAFVWAPYRALPRALQCAVWLGLPPWPPLPLFARLNPRRAAVQLGDAAGAMADYNSALALEPSNAAALCNRAALRDRQARIPRARSRPIRASWRVGCKHLEPTASGQASR